MKKILFLSLFLLMAGSVMAQKMVIGSRVPDFKGVQWMTTMPHTSETPEAAPMLIEFYNPDNASSVRFFSKLAGVKERHPKIQIVVLVARNKQSAEQLLESHGKEYYIGLDSDGKVYQAFNVRFLPYTILVNSKGELHWQGNLGNLTDGTLQKVK